MMSYDIPDEVKYREKIVFGLDLKQLCYACLFALLALFSYNLPLEGEAKLALPTLFGILGAGFILLNLEEKALDRWHYYTGVRKAAPADAQTRRFIGIKSVEDGTIAMMDGSLRAILQVEPINFSLLDEGQKAAFVSNYREFLNHLAAPVQILVRAENSDAEELFKPQQEKLKGASPEIASIFTDFFRFERDFLEQNRVKIRKYYIVVVQPAAALLGKPASHGEACRQLDQRVGIMQEKLASCGLKSKRLGKAQLRELLCSYSHKGEAGVRP